MIKTVLFRQQDIHAGEHQALLEQWHSDPATKLWVDLEYQDKREATDLLKAFDIHPLAVEDALRHRHPPKIEFFDNSLFILYRGIANVRDAMDFDHLQLAFFVGERFLVTVHSGPSVGINQVMLQLEQPRRNITGLKHDANADDLYSPFRLALNILRSSSGIYLENLLEFESNLSDIEDEMSLAGNDHLLHKLTTYKSRLVKLRRIFNYHQGITETLLDNLQENYLIPFASFEHTINDLHDRFERLHTLSQMHYDICGDVIEGYLSITSHRLNATMRVLTVITAVFVPLSFLAGVYGMNFENMPELKYQNAYYFLLAAMVLLAISLLLVFRRKRWL